MKNRTPAFVALIVAAAMLVGCAQVTQNEPVAVVIANAAIKSYATNHTDAKSAARVVIAQEVVDGLDAVFKAEQASAPGTENQALASLVTAVALVKADDADPSVQKLADEATIALDAVQANTSGTITQQATSAVTALVAAYLVSQF